MRPYLAVIKDSFREALASKVLWVLMIVFTLVLILLIPLSQGDVLNTRLRFDNVTNWHSLVTKLNNPAPGPSPFRRIRDDLGEPLQDELDDFEDARPGARQRTLRQLHGALNKQMAEADFYDAEAWSSVSLNEEARELIDRGATGPDSARLNRLLLEAAFPDEIRPSQRDAVTPTYFGFVILDDFVLNSDEATTLVETGLQLFIFALVSVIGVLVGILVTAPIVPRMLAAGSIDLLLSKPVSRSLLFLSKFFGGCAFIVLNASYLIVGLWLIAGLRFGVWSNKLLLSIPVFLFLFAIYYAVSSLTGVLFRGAIVSVIMTVVFWGVCWVTGQAKTLVETFGVNEARLHVLTPAGDAVLATSKSGATYAWNDVESSWDPVFQSPENNSVQQGQLALMSRFGLHYPLVGPVYDATNDRIVAVEKSASVLIPGGGPGRLLAGPAAEDWVRRGGIRLGVPARALFVSSDGDILTVSPSGLYRFEGDLDEAPKRQFKLFGLIDISGAAAGSTGSLKVITPDGIDRWQRPFAAAIEPVAGHLAIFADGTVQKLDRAADGSYTLAKSVDLETDEPAVVALGTSHLLVALGDGQYRLLDAGSLETQDQFKPYRGHKPRAALASPDGRYLAVITHHGELWVYDTLNRQVAGEFDDVHAAAFVADGKLMIADRLTRVIEYQLDSLEETRRLAPPLTGIHFFYQYILLPVYTIFPKPGELNSLNNYLLSDSESESVSGREDDLETMRQTVDIWQPVYSNLAFLVIVLGLTCLYISRKDF